MSTPTKKRAAPDRTASNPRKKVQQQPSAPEPIAIPDEDDESFHISIKPHSKFDVFPPKLRSLLCQSHRSTLRTYVHELSSHVKKHRETYSITQAQSIRPSISSGFTILQQVDNIQDLSLANIKLLEMALTHDKSLATMRKDLFVELETKLGMANLKFVHLHSVRHGELGWGVDTHGCVSLFKTSIVEEKLREEVWYVMKGGFKVEDDF